MILALSLSACCSTSVSAGLHFHFRFRLLLILGFGYSFSGASGFHFGLRIHPVSVASVALQVLSVVFSWRVVGIALMEAGISRRTMHHMRLTVHHITHGIMTITGGTWMRCINCSIRLINHRLYNSSPRIDEPIVYLQYR